MTEVSFRVEFIVLKLFAVIVMKKGNKIRYNSLCLTVYECNLASVALLISAVTSQASILPLS